MPDEHASVRCRIDDFAAVHTIDDVVDALSHIVRDARSRGDRLGLFAALYRRTTLHVRTALRAGEFHDAAWVERLDVVFARRYLDAYGAFERGQPTSHAWRVAFERSREPGHLLVHHLLLGMAAHILLDLGVATAETARDDLARRRADFMTINAVLVRMLDDVQADVNRISPALAWLDRAGGTLDERLAGAVVRRWRTTAWRRAIALNGTLDAARHARVRRFDRATVRVSERLCPARTGAGAPWLEWVRRQEAEDVVALIDAIV
jgi:hypothetical protein